MPVAIVVESTEAGPRAARRLITGATPGAGDLTIAVSYSSLNFKDGLALAGDPGVARHLPLVPGIDVVGRVVSDPTGAFQPGDAVLVNGAGLGERRDGGFSEVALVPAADTIPIPDGLSLRDAAAIGTAGFTAALCVLALEASGLEPDAGEVAVTGATGGVGSIATALLAGRGFSVAAITGRPAEFSDYLTGLGAARVLDRAEFASDPRPLEKARWAGGVDALGGRALAHLLAQTGWGGVIAACGLAESAELPTSVLPFILRAVTLAGINSVDAPAPLRRRAWALLADELDVALLGSITTEIPLDAVPAAGAEILAGRRHGRTVVRVLG